MKIEVTQDDIDHGRPLSGMSCPVALAMNRQAPEGTRWYVGRGAANTADHWVLLPRQVSDWIRDLEPVCQITEGRNGPPACGNPAQWLMIARCCGQQVLMCDQHVHELRGWVERFRVGCCGRCKTLFFGGFDSWVRAVRL